MEKKRDKVFLREQEIEMRATQNNDYVQPKKSEPLRDIWMRPNGEIPNDLVINQALLLYASDRGLLGTAQLPHGINFMSKYFQSASLDHAMWFHSKVDFSDWMLYRIDSPISRNARGFSRGSIFDSQGKLVASCVQEGLMRMWDKPKD
jgi:Acyl-CoA thioesterase